MIDNAPLGDASCPSLSPLPCPPPRPLRQHPAHFRLRPVLALGGRYRARPVCPPGWAAGSNGTGSSVVTRTAVLPPRTSPSSRLDVPARARLLCRLRERAVAGLADVPVRPGATVHGRAGAHRWSPALRFVY